MQDATTGDVILVCPGCKTPLAIALGFNLQIIGSSVLVTGTRIRLKCPKCRPRRVCTWIRPKN